jgi:predicted nucleic-acid-binding Zn-ribbon protein
MRLKDSTIENFFAKKAQQGACPSCGSTNWAYDDRIFEIREYTGGGLVVGSGASIAPYLTIACQNCGYTRFFNVIVAGLMRPDGTTVDS